MVIASIHRRKRVFLDDSIRSRRPAVNPASGGSRVQSERHLRHRSGAARHQAAEAERRRPMVVAHQRSGHPPCRCRRRPTARRNRSGDTRRRVSVASTTGWRSMTRSRDRCRCGSVAWRTAPQLAAITLRVMIGPRSPLNGRPRGPSGRSGAGACPGNEGASLSRLQPGSGGTCDAATRRPIVHSRTSPCNGRTRTMSTRRGALPVTSRDPGPRHRTTVSDLAQRKGDHP